MLFTKKSPGDFASFVSAAFILASLTPQISAANLLEDVIDPVPYYGRPSESASVDFPYSDFHLSSTVAPSASLYVYTSSQPSPYPLSSWPGQPSGMPYPIGTAPVSSWMPLNSTAAYPTGGWTHKVTPTSNSAPLVTQTSIATVAAPTASSAPPSPGTVEQSGATTLATSLAGLVFAAGITLLAL